MIIAKEVKKVKATKKKSDSISKACNNDKNDIISIQRNLNFLVISLQMNILRYLRQF